MDDFKFNITALEERLNYLEQFTLDSIIKSEEKASSELKSSIKYLSGEIAGLEIRAQQKYLKELERQANRQESIFFFVMLVITVAFLSIIAASVYAFLPLYVNGLVTVRQALPKHSCIESSYSVGNWTIVRQKTCSP
jgi:hypothetical protein